MDTDGYRYMSLEVGSLPLRKTPCHFEGRGILEELHVKGNVLEHQVRRPPQQSLFAMRIQSHYL